MVIYSKFSINYLEYFSFICIFVYNEKNER